MFITPKCACERAFFVLQKKCVIKESDSFFDTNCMKVRLRVKNVLNYIFVEYCGWDDISKLCNKSNIESFDIILYKPHK